MKSHECAERRFYNVANATGRVHGKYLADGEPRGGGSRRVVTENLVFYEAVQRPMQEVYGALGIGDEGRTPFTDLTPAVEPRRVQRISVFNGDVLVGRTIVDFSEEE